MHASTNVHVIDHFENLRREGYTPVEAGFHIVSLFPTHDWSPAFMERLTHGAMTFEAGRPKRVALIAAPIDLDESYTPKHRDPYGPKVEPVTDNVREGRARAGIPVPRMEYMRLG